MVQEIEKQKMESLNALVQANLKVSEAKNQLTKLQEEETVYLVAREKKALTKIQSILDESSDILKNIDTNYEEIKDIYKTVSNIATFLEESYKRLQELHTLFTKKTELWDSEITKKEENLEETKKKLILQTTTIKNDRESLKLKEKSLQIYEKKLNDERGVLERAITRLKEGKI